MSENEGYRTDDAPVPQANPGPRVDPVTADDDVQGSTNPGPREVPVPEDLDDDVDRQTREAEEREDSEGGPVPGEYPKDDPDLEGEERFDAG